MSVRSRLIPKVPFIIFTRRALSNSLSLPSNLKVRKREGVCGLLVGRPSVREERARALCVTEVLNFLGGRSGAGESRVGGVKDRRRDRRVWERGAERRVGKDVRYRDRLTYRLIVFGREESASGRWGGGGARGEGGTPDQRGASGEAGRAAVGEVVPRSGVEVIWVYRPDQGTHCEPIFSLGGSTGSPYTELLPFERIRLVLYQRLSARRTWISLGIALVHTSQLGAVRGLHADVVITRGGSTTEATSLQTDARWNSASAIASMIC